MARFLIVGAGKRASALAETLGRGGNALNVVESADRLGPVLAALEHVAIVCWLADVSPERFLLGAVDSSMRGFVYDARDWEPIVLETAARNSIPVVGVRAAPAADLDVWLTEVRQAIEHVLSGRYADSYT